jgi:DNA-binding CsgD family transcriptional regulator
MLSRTPVDRAGAVSTSVDGGSGMTVARSAGAPLGLEAQLAAVDAARREVARGETRAVFFTGVRGAGKSHLLAAAVAHLRGSGWVVLSGACLDIGEASLHPLRGGLRRLPPDQSGGAPGRAARDLLGLVEDRAQWPRDPGELMERLSAGLAAWADGRPIALVLDDLQWLDQTTCMFIRYLLSGLAGFPLLLIGAARVEPAGESGVRQLLAEWGRLLSVRVEELPPLDAEQTERLAAGIVGRPLDHDEAARMWRRSQGNPFVVEALARVLRATGDLALPAGLREIALAQIAGLPPGHVAVLRAIAAAGGDPVEHRLLVQVAGQPEAIVDDAVRMAEEQRILLVDPDGYRFRLGLFAEALESTILPGERERLHRAYATALAARADAQARHARLARHWRLAGEGGRALRSAIDAARQAEHRYQSAEAYQGWTLALELMAEVGPAELEGLDRHEILRAGAEAAHRCGEHDQAVRLVDELAGAPEERVPTTLRVDRARYLTAAGRPDEAEAEYRAAMANTHATPRDRAATAAHFADFLVHHSREAEAGPLARQALEAGGEDPASYVLASAALGFSEACRGHPEEGRRTLESALRTAERTCGPVDVARAHQHLAELLTGILNEVDAGVEVALRGVARSDEHGLGRTYGARLLATAARGLYQAGRWADAEKTIADAMRRRPSGSAAIDLLLARCRIAVATGDPGAARDLDAVDALRIGAGSRHAVPLLTLRAALAIWRGHHADARAAVEQGLDGRVSRSDDVRSLAVLLWHGLWAEAESRVTGRTEPSPATVRRLDAEVERVRRQAATLPRRGTVAAWLAMAAAERRRVDGEPVADRWADCVARWDELGHPYPAAYARLRLAEALLAGAPAGGGGAVGGGAVGGGAGGGGAGDVLRAAYRAARALGAQPLADHIGQAARSAQVSLHRLAPREATVDPPRPGRLNPLTALTPRELQVLMAMEEGDSNKQIAPRLNISTKTVAVHATNIYRKLKVSGRVQACAMFREHYRD